MAQELRQVEYPCTGSRVHFAIPWQYTTPHDVLVIVREPKGQREHALLHGADYALNGPMITLAKPPGYGSRVLLLFQGEHVRPVKDKPVAVVGAVGKPAPVVEQPPIISAPAPILAPVVHEPEDYDEENDPVLRDDVAKLGQLTEKIAQQQQQAAQLSLRQMQELRQWQSSIEERLARVEAVLALLGENAKHLLEAEQ